MKLTRKEYTKQYDRLLRELDTVETAMGDIQALPTGHERWDYWNGLHDKAADLKTAIKDLAHQWDTRNWTSQDWQQWDLVTSNID